MPYRLTDLTALAAHGFDAIIDVRSPAEFAEDHVPGAINLPVFSNDERARVGTVYVQESAFLARKLGAAILARNAAAHIEGPLADKPGGWKPLVYCWRGGQRSGAFASILAQIGWRVDTVEGGYKSYRRLIVRAMHERPLAHRFVLLDGYTGTAKTDLLNRVRARGGQILDLEGLARHRGSLLGGMPGGQPAQKAFEGALALALQALDPARPVLVEAESSRIGERLVPPMIWEAMKRAPRIDINAPVPARARYLTAAYADLIGDRARLGETLTRLVPLQGRDRVAAWQGLVDDDRFQDLAAALIEDHYDPRYRRSRAQHEFEILERLDLPDLTGAELDRAADRITGLLAARP